MSQSFLAETLPNESEVDMDLFVSFIIYTKKLVSFCHDSGMKMSTPQPLMKLLEMRVNRNTQSCKNSHSFIFEISEND